MNFYQRFYTGNSKLQERLPKVVPVEPMYYCRYCLGWERMHPSSLSTLEVKGIQKLYIQILCATTLKSELTIRRWIDKEKDFLNFDKAPYEDRVLIGYALLATNLSQQDSQRLIQAASSKAIPRSPASITKHKNKVPAY